MANAISHEKMLSWALPVLSALMLLLLNDMRDGIKEGKSEIKEARQEFSMEVKEINRNMAELSSDVEAIKVKIKQSSITTKEPATYYARYKDENGNTRRVLLKDATFESGGD